MTTCGGWRRCCTAAIWTGSACAPHGWSARSRPDATAWTRPGHCQKHAASPAPTWPPPCWTPSPAPTSTAGPPTSPTNAGHTCFCIEGPRSQTARDSPGLRAEWQSLGRWLNRLATSGFLAGRWAGWAFLSVLLLLCRSYRRPVVRRHSRPGGESGRALFCCRLMLGVPPHEAGVDPDDVLAAGHPEAELLIEGDVTIDIGLEKGGQALLVGRGQQCGEEGFANAVALQSRPDADRADVPVGLAGVVGLALAHHGEGSRQGSCPDAGHRGGRFDLLRDPQLAVRPLGGVQCPDDLVCLHGDERATPRAAELGHPDRLAHHAPGPGLVTADVGQRAGVAGKRCPDQLA